MARLAPKLLGESVPLVEGFLKSSLGEAGGFSDREGRPDLYYTVFGIEAMLALRLEPPRERLARFLDSFDDPGRLDFVHACSLARCGAGLEKGYFDQDRALRIADRIAEFRTPDGGFHGTPGKARGSAYGALLAWGAHADLGVPLPEPERLLNSVQGLRLDDASFANEPGLPQGTTTATGAAVTLLRHLGGKIDDATPAWLLAQVHPSGGFLATPRAPLPDLLSTAVALHALDALETPFEQLREPCLDFVDSLWSAEGGFHGHWADDHLDCEYTYYGLLALGHLAL